MAKFQKGNSLGSLKKGKKYFSVATLMTELEKEAKKRGTSFYGHIAKRCFEDDGILKGVMNKFIPDLSEVEAEVNITFVNRIPLPEVEK